MLSGSRPAPGRRLMEERIHQVVKKAVFALQTGRRI